MNDQHLCPHCGKLNALYLLKVEHEVRVYQCPYCKNQTINAYEAMTRLAEIQRAHDHAVQLVQTCTDAINKVKCRATNAEADLIDSEANRAALMTQIQDMELDRQEVLAFLRFLKSFNLPAPIEELRKLELLLSGG